ncbi:hypothetical protein [Alkalibacterium olivapovliticus]
MIAGLVATAGVFIFAYTKKQLA